MSSQPATENCRHAADPVLSQGHGSSVQAGQHSEDLQEAAKSGHAATNDYAANSTVEGMGSGGSVAAKAVGQTEEQLLEALKAYVRDKGSSLENGWSVEKRQRSGGSTAGHWDAYYFSPSGKKFRSRLEVGKALGIEEERKPKKTANAATPPADKGAAIPGGSELPTAARDDVLARVRASAAALNSTLPLALGNGLSLLSLGHIDTRASYHTSTCLLPVGLTTQVWDASGTVFQSRIADGGSTGPVFVVSLVLHPANGSAPQVQLAGEASADAAWARVASLQAAARAAPHSAQPPAERSPAQHQAAGVGLAGGASSAIDASQSSHGLLADASVRQALSRASGLSQKWGTEMFGLADAGVLMRIEALPGVEQCQAYQPTEQRGGWEAARKLLEREAHKRQKAAAKDVKAAAKAENPKKRGRPPKDPTDVQDKPRKKPNAGQGMENKASTGGRQLTLLASTPGAPAGSGTSSGMLGLGPAHAQAQPGALQGRGRGRGRERGRGGGSGGGRALRMSHEEAEVRRAINRIIDQLEKDAERQTRKAEKKAQKAAEKDAERAAKAAEREAERGRARTAADARAEQMRVLSAVDVEDTQLPGADRPLPPPQPVAEGILPAELVSGLLELWELLCQFPDVLGIHEIPSIDDLACSLDIGSVAGLQQQGGAGSSPTLAIIETVLQEAFDAAIDIAADASSDVKSRDLGPALPALKADTWQELAHRLAALCSVGRMVQRSEGQASGGLDVALGPNVGATPLAALGPAIVLQYLIAGAICPSPAASAAALPLGACSSAPEAVMARHDARALADAEGRLPAASRSHRGDWQQQKDNLVVAGRGVLERLSRLKGPRLPDGQAATCRALTFNGLHAAAAARSAQVIDLMIIGARIEAGIYSVLEDGLAALEDDVRATCDLFRSAAKRTGSDFAADLGDAKAVKIAEQVWEKLGSVITQQRGLADGTTSQRQPATPSPAPSATDDEEVAKQRRNQDPVKDLRRPFSPWDGCCICWRNDDRKHILLCDGCDAEMHVYCVEPPLSAIPSGEWYCPACTAELSEQGELPDNLDIPAEASWRVPQQNDFSIAAHVLGTCDWADLTPHQRMGVIVTLARLAGDSGAARTQLAEDDAARKEDRKQLDELRKQARKEEKERAEQAQQRITDFPAGTDSRSSAAAGPSGASAPRTRTRAEEAAEQQVVTTYKRISELEERVKRRAKQHDRLASLGYDRCWNRYWVLGSLVPGSCGTVFVEQRGHLGAPQADTEDVLSLSGDADSAARTCTWGSYPTCAEVDTLLAQTNHRGKREGPLRRALMHFRHHMPQPKEEDPPAADGAAIVSSSLPAKGPAKQPATSPGTPPPDHKHSPSANDADMDTARAAAEPDTAKTDGTEPPSNALSPLAVPADMQLADKAAGSDTDMAAASTPTPAVREAAAPLSADAQRKFTVSAIAAELTSIMGSVSEELRPEWGHPNRVQRWQELVSSATTPQDLMAAVLVLESMIPPARLKPWWRLWAFPVPLPSQTGTLAAVLARVNALRAALKKSAAAGWGAGLAVQDFSERAGRATRGYSMRERRLAPGAMAEDALESAMDELGESDGGRGSRRDRAARRAGRTSHRTSPSPLGNTAGPELNERALRRLAREGRWAGQTSREQTPEPRRGRQGREATPPAPPAHSGIAAERGKGERFRRIVTGRARAQAEARRHAIDTDVEDDGDDGSGDDDDDGMADDQEYNESHTPMPADLEDDSN